MVAKPKKSPAVESADVASKSSSSPNQWLRSLSAFDRNRVYSLTASLAEQSNGVSQNDFILQYALGKRDWKADHDKMFGAPAKKAN